MKNDDSFDLELEKFNSGNLPDSHIFNLGKPGEILQNCGFPAVHRIELAAARLRMKANQGNHPFEILDIQGLAGALQKPVAVFEYGDKNKSQNVIVNIEKDGKNFLVGVFFNQIRDGFEVSSIRGLFNRDNMDWMHWIQQGKMIYGNKEKIQVLAEQQRTNLADVHSKEARTSSDSYYLDSVDNILQSFGDVKDIYTKDFPKYAEQKERFEIFKKFRSAYQEVNAINALNAVQEADEFYDALKSNNKEVIARYTDAFKYPALADTAKSIIEERSFSQKEKSQEIQYAEHLMAQGLDSLDSNKILHQTNSLDNKTTSTLVIDSNQAARIKAAREIKENMPNLSEKERAAAIAILEAGAKSQDMEFSEYVEKTFPDGIFGDIEKAENAAKQQGVKINGAVSVNGFGENVRAVIYAGKNADFSTWCHELSHIWQAQLTGELKQNAEEAFQVKDSDWQNSIYTFKDGHTDTSAEAFAYGFEDFLKNKAGEMAAEDKKKIFEKFADYMSRTYNGIKQHIEINEKIASVYQKFVELDDNILAQAEKAVQMEKNAKLGIPEAERQRESVKKLYQDTDKWLKAPNGNQTKLSEEQWIAVRTPNFKRWFGNWEFNENKIVKTVELNDSEVEFNHNNAREVEKWLKENLSGKSIIIDSSGAKVLIFNKGLKDSLKRHGEIQRNSYAVLEDLISKSELFDFIKSDGKSKHNGLLGQDVYYSALKVGNNYYSVQFKFDVSAKYRTDSYKDHKIMEIKTAPLLYHGSKDAHAITSAVHNFTISQLTNGVKPNFSKMLDENGEPLVVYHGSPNKGFDVFDKNKIGSTTDYGIYGKGFYFSNKKNQAELYGDTVDVFLNIRKPFVLTDYHSPEQIADELDAYPEYFSIQNERVKPIGSFAKQGFVSYLEAKNYDGVIVKQTESTNEIVSFYANQIKSSIDNNGNFDINNDSILFQTAYHGSGANFDKFNTSEYGWSGEGYMAFGYGTYVTDSESIAKDYASAQGKREPGKRNFYTVEIPDGNYLKWEKKVGVRTIKKVATELENLGIKNISFIRKDFRDWPLATQLNYIIHNESMTNKGSGKDLYITVGSILHSPADKETSKFFKDIGFSGIEYPAGTFSGERQNAVNYVIFDDNDIKIKNHFQFQIIGELGARELDRNAESNERIANLETAKRMEEAQSIVNPTRDDRLSTISVPLNKEYNENFALSTVEKLLETEKNVQKATAADFQQIEPALQKKFDKLKAAIKSREEQDIQDISAAEEPGNKKKAIRSKSDIIRQAGKDFLKSVKEGIAPFFNAEDDFQRIIMHPQAIINASNGLPFSGESQLLAQIYHQRQRMEGEVVTSIAGAKAAGTIVLDTPESRQKNFALTDTSSLAEKNAIVRTRYFMPESCEEPDKIYAHTLQRQRPDKIRSYRDLIRHFENIPNGQKEISDIRIRIAHEHLKEIQSRFAIKEKRVLSVDEIEERKNFLRNYFERLPADYRNSERSAFEDTFGIQLNSEKNLEINLQRDFKDIDFAELKKNTKKSIELENRKLSDFIEKNTMEDKKLATLLSDEYKSLSKEEKMTVRNLKIEAIGIKEPETFLGKYLAACNTNAEFITDKETVEEVKKNLVKKLEKNFKLEKYDILKEIGQQAQSIGNETTKKISFEKAHSNNKSLEKTQSPNKEISLIGIKKTVWKHKTFYRRFYSQTFGTVPGKKSSSGRIHRLDLRNSAKKECHKLYRIFFQDNP